MLDRGLANYNLLKKKKIVTNDSCAGDMNSV